MKPSMKPSEILKKALELLGEDGENWCQDVGAVDRDGLQVLVNDRSAVKFCGYGACQKVDDGLPSLEAAYYLRKVVTPMGLYADWQDKPNRTFPEVKAKFLLAIELAEAEENKEAVK
jgi:hypothetical protein